MSSEKKSVLAQLILSVMVVVALYLLIWFWHGQMHQLVFEICVLVLLGVGAFAIELARQLWFLQKEPMILARFDASRPLPPTRIAAIACRRRRDQA
ncbi:MAG: hypothetical protein AAB849_02680 [Patescibacteria group bacterium]